MEDDDDDDDGEATLGKLCLAAAKELELIFSVDGVREVEDVLDIDVEVEKVNILVKNGGRVLWLGRSEDS